MTRLRWFQAATWIVIAVGVLGIGLVGALRWSLIPVAIDERVVDSGYQDGSSDRLRTLNLESGRRIVVDRSLIYRCGDRDALRGVRVSKQRWETTLVVEGREVGLRPSGEFWRTMAALTCAVALATWRRFRAGLLVLDDLAPGDADAGSP